MQGNSYYFIITFINLKDRRFALFIFLVHWESEAWTNLATVSEQEMEDPELTLTSSHYVTLGMHVHVHTLLPPVV